MNTHFNIMPQGNFEKILEKILQQAQTEPHIFHIDREKRGQYLVFLPFARNGNIKTTSISKKWSIEPIPGSARNSTRTKNDLCKPGVPRSDSPSDGKVRGADAKRVAIISSIGSRYQRRYYRLRLQKPREII